MNGFKIFKGMLIRYLHNNQKNLFTIFCDYQWDANFKWIHCSHWQVQLSDFLFIPIVTNVYIIVDMCFYKAVIHCRIGHQNARMYYHLRENWSPHCSYIQGVCKAKKLDHFIMGITNHHVKWFINWKFKWFSIFKIL